MARPLAQGGRSENVCGWKQVTGFALGKELSGPKKPHVETNQEGQV